MEQRKVSVTTTTAVILKRSTTKLGVTQLTQKRDGIGVLYQRVMVSIKLIIQLQSFIKAQNLT